ncbi:MAG: helix-turn-helix domain-containing protein [Chloroflexi bacterium]|nr:helix-turn-helix domain-containing protein [Chloroflexota bacterium]MBV9895274.1 helix-turn-helix domain-containing protein [Chloroflexota bacterium]
MADDPLLTVNEVAERLKLNPKTIRRWIQSGKLHAIGLGSDRAGYRIRASEIELLLQGGAQTRQLPLPSEAREPKKLAA